MTRLSRLSGCEHCRSAMKIQLVIIHNAARSITVSKIIQCVQGYPCHWMHDVHFPHMPEACLAIINYLRLYNRYWTILVGQKRLLSVLSCRVTSRGVLCVNVCRSNIEYNFCVLTLHHPMNTHSHIWKQWNPFPREATTYYLTQWIAYRLRRQDFNSRDINIVCPE